MSRVPKGAALPPLLLGLLLPVLPVHAAGAPIDPDPRAPSLAELLQQAEAEAVREAQAAAANPARQMAAVSEPSPAPASLPSSKAAASPKAAATPTDPAAPPQRVVRQVYPSPYGASAVTVLVPGARGR